MPTLRIHYCITAATKLIKIRLVHRIFYGLVRYILYYYYTQTYVRLSITYLHKLSHERRTRAHPDALVIESCGLFLILYCNDIMTVRVVVTYVKLRFFLLDYFDVRSY